MADQPINFSAVPKTMGRLMGEKNLKVPPSQRSYRWKEEHVQDLFKDIKAARCACFALLRAAGVVVTE